MPLYTVMTQAGALSGDAKAKLASELTTFHSEYAGVPKNWVHIVFQDYAPGSGLIRQPMFARWSTKPAYAVKASGFIAH